MGNARYGYYGENGWEDVEADDEKAERVEIDVEEYNGLLVALDMVRRRALQQVDKSKADEHGYLLLRADKKLHKEYKKKCWLVTKTTPYSIKIPPEQAQKLIEKDLRDFYGLVFPKKFNYPYKGNNHIAKVGENLLFNNLLRTILNSDLDEQYEHRDNWAETISLAYQVREYLRSIDFRFSFDICKLSCNYAQGRYEVSYWQYKL